MKQYFQYVDRLKGFAMLCVVLGHLVCYTMYDNWQDSIHDFNLAIVNLFHMPLFIFLSGFVVKTPPDFKKLIKKCYCFMIPFLFFGGVYSFVINSTVEFFFINEFKNGYWYLMVLSIFYCLISLQRFAKNRFLEFIIPLVVFAFLVILNRNLPVHISKAASLGMCQTLYPFFMLGYFARRFNGVEWLLRRNWLFTIALLSSIPLFVLFHTGKLTHFIQILVILILIVLLVLFRKRENSSSSVEKVLALIGKNSLDVYVFQYFFFIILNLRGAALWFKSTENFLFESFFLVFIALVVSILCIYVGRLLKQSVFINKFVYGSFWQ